MKTLIWLLLFLMAMAGVCACAEEPAEGQVVLSFAGDCTLGSASEYQNYSKGFVTMVAELGFAHPFSGVRHIFANDDLTLVNLEGTFTTSTKAADKLFTFRAPPEYAQILPLGSVEAVNVANNHIADFLDQGKEDTLAALEAVSVLYSGNGALAVYEAKGITIGMTGYSYPHWNTLALLESVDIPQLREMGCDIIILSLHAGREEQYRATSQQKELARGAIDLGVDIVVGHHAHVLQAVEVYRGKPIFYGLGNFAFGGNMGPEDWDTMIGQVVVEKLGSEARVVEMRIIPCLISGADRWSDYRPVVATLEQAKAIWEKIGKYSTDIDPSIFDMGVLRLAEETAGADSLVK